MKNCVGALTLCVVLAACGGGSGGSSGGVAGGGNPPPPPLPPPPPPVSVAIVSGDIARYAATATGLSVDVVAKPVNFTAAALYATATDKDGLIQPAVAVAANADGSFTLSLDTRPQLDTGRHAGSVTLNLCSDAACKTPLAVPSVSVPYNIVVLEKGSAWPGDKLTALSPWTDVPDWSTFQGNPGHTGFVAATLNPDQFTLRWKTGPISTQTGQFGYEYFQTLTAAKGLLYAAGENKLKAFKEFDGSVAWTYDVSTLANPSVNPPAVADGVVYMAAGQQDSTYMFGFDAVTGAIRFKSPMRSQWEHYLAPVAADNMVYTNAGMYGGLYAFSSTGDQAFFRSDLSQMSMWSPTLDATSVYAYVGDSLVAFDRKTGLRTSTIKDTEFQNFTYQVNGAAVLGAPGNMFAANYGAAVINGGTMGNSLLKFNVAKGFIDWRIAGNYLLTPAYASGVVYAVNTNPYRFEARSEADAGLLWSWTPPMAGERTWAGEPVVTKNLLFVSTNMATYAVDLRSHKVVWSYPAAGRLALTQSGILYIQNTDALVAINLK